LKLNAHFGGTIRRIDGVALPATKRGLHLFIGRGGW
jgi:hypothetical protein